jgi:hypothetical protein
MKAFISTVFCYNSKGINTDGGILGVVKGYSGCVEAQGRGMLHCHMMIWIKGTLNPNEICVCVLKDDEDKFKTRLLSFLDDTISNFLLVDPNPSLLVPASKHHPCSVQGIDLQTESGNWQRHSEKDLHHLVCDANLILI